ncbi:MAG: ATP-binding protein [Puniceicoccales bacterium]|jgi:predicted AAA+ superfamily ATPase|nr:ATP-binding protein [Puniceicoccales bacterium]
MKRIAMEGLLKWKNNPGRMPLIIEGARQVGKTWLMKEFGRMHYENAVYVNFDGDRKVKKLFEQDLNPARIVDELELQSGEKIRKESTLIIFDEIQECNRACVSLKYFCENAPEYHVISAGSLLGVAIHRDNSFPVGKVNSMHLYPLTFEEFMDALGEKRYQTLVEKKNYSSAYAIGDDLTEHLKRYYFVGGMPKAVKAFVDGENLSEIRQLQREIMENFEKDFSKHIDVPSIPKIGQVWDSVPSQLAKENKQFVYSEMKKGARGSHYESAFYWLKRVGMVYKVPRVEIPNLPLAAYKQDAFKVYMLDVGLLSARVGLTMQNLADPNPEMFNHFRGALTEQYVLQELKALPSNPEVCYWMNNRKKGTAEVDFLIQNDGEVIPIEAKSSTNLKAKSLKVYMNYYKPQTAIRTSLGAYGKHGNLWDIPLYLLGQLPHILHGTTDPQVA